MKNRFLTTEEIRNNKEKNDTIWLEFNEMYEDLKRQREIDMVNKIKSAKWTKQTITEWDDSVSNVEVAVVDNMVYVKYEDGTIYKEEKARFDAGKWADSIVTEAFKYAIEEMARAQAVAREFTRRVEKQREYVTVFRNGDTCRVLKEELRLKEVRDIFTEHEVIMKGILEDGTIVEVCRFYPDEIWVSTYELQGKTLKEALDIKYEKDRRYLRS